MTLMYALPEIPPRADNRPRPSGLLGVGTVAERPRKLTPYPDPSQTFPLSDDAKDLNEDEVNETVVLKAIEIDFTPPPASLRRTPSVPAKKLEDGNQRQRRSSLPSLKGSALDNAPSGVGKRRRGWIVPKEIIRECLADLKSLASSEHRRRSDISNRSSIGAKLPRRPNASSSSDGTSLVSNPYTACNSLSISVYSQSSTSLPYFRSQSIKSVEAYFEAKPVVARAKKGKLSRACRFFLSGRDSKQTIS